MEQGDSVGHSTIHDPTVSTSDLAPLGEWFSRPLLLETFVWNEATVFDATTISPWFDYFNSPNIRRKLEGFSRLRCDLKIKVLVNGSPFRYGELMMSYRPLYAKVAQTTHDKYPFFSGGQIAGDVLPGYPSQDFSLVDADKSTLMARSQRPHIRIQPHINSGGEMTIPFIYYKDAIDITNLSVTEAEWQATMREMGTLTIEQIAILRSTATANSTGVSISIFAWAENVKLWGPTGVNVQAQDEYETSLSASGQASAVAEAAGKLQSVPILRPYALATQFLAGTTANVLKYFGWSNPPVLTAVQAKLPKASFLNPGPCSSFPDDVLALDPKNELTVDPRTVGAQPADPLLISDFCARSAIVDVFDWQITDPVDTLLAEFPIHPAYWHAEFRTRPSPNTSSTRLTMTPATYASQLFEYWRGTCCIKLKVVASQFHRGRLVATWDPARLSSSATYKDAAQITHIIDLASATEMTIKIPYLNHQGMLRTSHFPLTISTSNEASFKPWTIRDDPFNWTKAQLYDTCNGILQIYVLNNLQCGDATADLKIIAEMSFEDMILMCPTVDSAVLATNDSLPSKLALISLSDWTDQDTTTTPSENVAAAFEFEAAALNVQGMEAPGTSEDMQMISGGPQIEEISKLYGGECVPSLRSLLHRTYFYKCKSTLENSNSGTDTITQMTLPRFPVPCNTKVNDFFEKLPASRTQAANTNLQATNPISLLTACFTGYRGSFVWKALSMNASDSLQITKSKPQFSVTNFPFGSITAPFGAADALRFDALVTAASFSTNGISWSSKELAGTVAAVFPQYNNMRMMPGDPVAHYLAPKIRNIDAFDRDGVKVTAFRASTSSALGTSRKHTIATSVSAGTDYNVFNFVNIPDIYVRASGT